MTDGQTRMCTGCGRQIPIEYNVCPHCGRPQNQAQVQSAAGINANSKIAEAIRIRPQTDELMEIVWLILLVLTPIISIIGVLLVLAVDYNNVINGNMNNFGWSIFASAIISLLASILYIFINYKLIKRNDSHSRRESTLREGIIEYFTLKAKERGMENTLSSQIATMQSIHSESVGDENNQHGWLAILIIIPILGTFIQLYILYILTKYDVNHDQRWHAFAQQAQAAGQTLGMTMVFPSWKNTPQRSFFLYLVLSIITLGLFLIYWYYVLMKDINEHYKAQWQFEDQLAKAI